MCPKFPKSDIVVLVVLSVVCFVVYWIMRGLR